MRRSSDDLLLLLVVLLWALNFTVSKYILTHGFAPLAYSSVRYVAAAVIFAAFTYSRERSLRIGRGHLAVIVFAVAILVVNQFSFIYALHFTTAATTALLFGTLPIFTALFSWALRLEALSSRFWVSAVISFGGVALVSIGRTGGISGNLKGDGLAVLGAMTWAAYSVAIAPLMRDYSPYRLSSVILLASAALLLLAGSGQLAAQDFHFGPLIWAGFAFAVLGPLVVTNVLWFRAIDRVGPSRASLFANLQPFLAAVFALILLSESITRIQVAGGLMIAAGILLAPRRVLAVAPAE